jgi:hypothetical protein
MAHNAHGIGRKVSVRLEITGLGDTILKKTLWKKGAHSPLISLNFLPAKNSMISRLK